MYAQVTGIFTSSAEVMISVCGESPTVREVFYCGDAFATVVSVNRTGGTVDIPFTLEPETGAEKQRCAGAEVRRQERLAVDALLYPPAVHKCMQFKVGVQHACYKRATSVMVVCLSMAAVDDWR